MSWFTRNPKKTLSGCIVFTYLVFDLIAGSLLLFDTTRIYHPVFHHGFLKNRSSWAKWGKNRYIITTDSFGFKDGRKREIPLTSPQKRIVVIGDSFTEGVGYPHEKTFVGVAERNLNAVNIDIFNAGVMSYSPKLYYLKIRYLLEKVGFRFNVLYVYLDVSDIQDEIVYREFIPGKGSFLQTIIRKIDNLCRNHLYTYRTIRDYILFGNGNQIIKAWQTKSKKFMKIISHSHLSDKGRKGSTLPGDKNIRQYDGAIDMQRFYESFDHDRDRWYDDTIFQAWGAQGLQLAEEHMKQLNALCKSYGIQMIIAVYPWANHIENKELTSRQVIFWQEFARRYSIDFLNYFPDFINATEPGEVIKANFIPEDIHWNSNGHELIAKKLTAHIMERIK